MWNRAAKITDISEGKGAVVIVDGTPIALFRKEGTVYALHNVCPHRGGPLGEGYLDGFEVTCPWHAWTFDIRNGACADQALKQKSYPAKIEGQDVFVDCGV